MSILCTAINILLQCIIPDTTVRRFRKETAGFAWASLAWAAHDPEKREAAFRKDHAQTTG
jgi:hypothetical protein